MIYYKAFVGGEKMIEVEIRQFLTECKKANKGPEEIFPDLARSALLYYVPSNDDEFKGFEHILKTKDGEKFPLIFTDYELACDFCRSSEIDSKVLKVTSRIVLQEVLKLDFAGVSINTNDESQLILDKQLLLLLFKEHLLIDFYMKGGAWCLYVNKQYLIYELAEGVQVIPGFMEENEAIKFGESLKEQTIVKFVNWKELLTFLVNSKLQYLVYAPQEPEMMVIEDPYLSWLYDSPFQE